MKDTLVLGVDIGGSHTTAGLIDIETRVLPNGGVKCSAHCDFRAPEESAKTAVAKAMFALNEYCHARRLGFHLEAHDSATGKVLNVSFTESRAKDEGKGGE